MPNLKFPEAIKQLKTKEYAPIYFFHGEESYFIDTLTKEIEQNALPEGQQAFNQTIVYGKDIGSEPGKIIDLALRLPMMAERQVIIIKEAQNIRNWDSLLPYLKNPTPTTLLCFAHKNKKLDGRSSFAKELKKTAIVVESPLYRDYQIPAWVMDYVKAKGFTITQKATQLLVEFLGTDLGKIANELEKLFLVVDSKNITPEEIEENIGISKDFNVFELQNALMTKNKVKVFQILDYFKHNPKAGNIVFVNTMIFSLFAKLYTLSALGNASDSELAKQAKIPPFFLKDYKTALRHYSPSAIQRNIKFIAEYDLKSKGLGNVNTPHNELMREMAYKLML